MDKLKNSPCQKKNAVICSTREKGVIFYSNSLDLDQEVLSRELYAQVIRDRR